MNRILAAALGASLLAASGVAVAQDHPDYGQSGYDHSGDRGYDHRDDRGGDHRDWRRHDRGHRQICHWRYHRRVCYWAR
jgi:hypothetical protein